MKKRNLFSITLLTTTITIVAGLLGGCASKKSEVPTSDTTQIQQNVEETKEKTKEEVATTENTETQAGEVAEEKKEEVVPAPTPVPETKPKETVKPAETTKPVEKPKEKQAPAPAPKPVEDIWNYQSANLTISIEPFTKTNPNIKYWIAHIKIKDPAQIKTAFGSDTFGGKRQKTSTITANHGGILGINASGFSFDTNKPTGVVIRDGKIYNDGKGKPFCIKTDGTMFTPDKPMTAQELLNEGVKHTFNFGPLLLQNGQKVAVTDGTHYPRTAIGQVSATEYYIIVADGKRTNYSVGLTPAQLQEEFLKRGVKYAYNLDGGGSTTLYFKGRVVNIPSDGSERPVADVLYFVE